MNKKNRVRPIFQSTKFFFRAIFRENIFLEQFFGRRQKEMRNFTVKKMSFGDVSGETFFLRQFFERKLAKKIRAIFSR